jgi:hypothetical protein
MTTTRTLKWNKTVVTTSLTHSWGQNSQNPIDISMISFKVIAIQPKNINPLKYKRDKTFKKPL